MADQEKAASNGNAEKGGVQRADTNGTAVDKSLPFNAHTASSSKVLEALNVDPLQGLTDADVAKRIEVYGPNRLKPPRRPSVWSILLRQIGNAMTIVLSESLLPAPRSAEKEHLVRNNG